MWIIKVLIQFILAHVPFGENINYFLQRMQRKRRGGHKKQLEIRIMELADGMRKINLQRPIEGATIVEVGTGWDPIPTLLLFLMGARSIYTYDHVRHLRYERLLSLIDFLNGSIAMLESCLGISEGLLITRLTSLGMPSKNLEELLLRLHITYRAPADASVTGLAPASVDIFYSHAVLEHVPETAIMGIINESKRVLKKDGVFYALIGLHDHYHGFDKKISKINFLKYPEWLWCFLVKNKISYHNRLRERDFLDMLAACKAQIIKIWSITDENDLDMLKTMKIDKRFRHYSPEELAVTSSEVIACFP